MAQRRGFTVGQAPPPSTRAPERDDDRGRNRRRRDDGHRQHDRGNPNGHSQLSICGPMRALPPAVKPAGVSWIGDAGGAARRTECHRHFRRSSPARPVSTASAPITLARHQQQLHAASEHSAVSCFTVPEPRAVRLDQLASPRFLRRGPGRARELRLHRGLGWSWDLVVQRQRGQRHERRHLGARTPDLHGDRDQQRRPEHAGHGRLHGRRGTLGHHHLAQGRGHLHPGQRGERRLGCSEGQYGSGLASCNAPSGVDTNSLGTHAFSVTAASTDGQQSTSTVHYNVVLPSNHF